MEGLVKMALAVISLWFSSKDILIRSLNNCDTDLLSELSSLASVVHLNFWLPKV